jgi:hypothetical protein
MAGLHDGDDLVGPGEVAQQDSPFFGIEPFDGIIVPDQP